MENLVKNQEKTQVNYEGESNNETPKIILLENYLKKKYVFRYNEISNYVEFADINTPKSFSVFGDTEYFSLYCELQRKNFKGIGDTLKALLRDSTFSEKYNPITSYFSSLPNYQNTEKDYISELASYVKVDNSMSEFFAIQFKKHLVRTVACALHYIGFNKQCLTLIGKQNDGKSTFLRFLCPPYLKDYYKENITLDKYGNLALAQNFIINLDELASLSRYDITRIKQLLSTDTIKERLTYGINDVVLKRVCSFFGSTNKDEFLTDETGNVRWLCFKINGIDFNYSKNIDIDKVWSQAYSLLKSGFQYQINNSEMQIIEDNNKDFSIRSLEHELLMQNFLPANPNSVGTWLTATKILEELMRLTEYQYKSINIIILGKALKQLGFHNGKRNGLYKWYVLDNPEKVKIPKAEEAPY